MPKSFKMSIKMPLLLILAIVNDCVGPRMQDSDWTPEFNEKLFKIYRGISAYKSNKPGMLKREWNGRYPKNKVLNETELYERACSVLEDKCREWEHRTGISQKNASELLSNMHNYTAVGIPEDEKMMQARLINDNPDFLKVDNDLTWSLVHNWYKYNSEYAAIDRNQVKWTPEMKADLLYIRERVTYGEGRLPEKLKAEWKLLYPKLNIKAESLRKYARQLLNEKFKPTEAEWEQAKKKYDRVHESKRETNKQHDEKKHLTVSIPSPQQIHQDELLQQLRAAPLYSPSYIRNFSYPPEYGLHHPSYYSPSYPSSYNPNYHFEQGSSSQNPEQKSP